MKEQNSIIDNENQREIGEVDENILSKEIELDDQKLTVERDMKDVLKYDKSLKIVLLGETMVGKSSIVHRVCDGKFIDHLSPTISIEYFNYITRVNKDLTIRMQIWDTAGQEKFDSIVKQYYQSSDFGIYIYAIDDLQSFEKLKDWVYKAKDNNNNNDMKGILLGNKSDLESNRKVSYYEGEKFAKENKFILFKEISCKNDNDSEKILEVFDEISKITYAKGRTSVLDSDSMNYEATNSMRALNKKMHKEKKKKCCK
jgi:small GTP-binding protein